MVKDITLRREGSGSYPIARRRLFALLPGTLVSAHDAWANEVGEVAFIRSFFETWLRESGLSRIFYVWSLRKLSKLSEDVQTLALERGLFNGEFNLFISDTFCISRTEIVLGAILKLSIRS